MQDPIGFGGGFFNDENAAEKTALVERQKLGMTKTFSRCGWATLGLSAFLSLAGALLSLILAVLDSKGIGAFAFFNKYLLVFNEVVIACSVGFGALLLLDADADKPKREKFGAKSFFAPLTVCFPIAYIGNFLGNAVINFWGPSSGVTDPLDEMLAGVDPLQMVLCVGIAAPIIEELFFRKLLIDRMHKYGDTAAIVISALLFGLFHQNFGQFFYAAGIGLVLGYMYCRTGSLWLTVALHTAFNLISGVWPALASRAVYDVLFALDNLGDREVEAMLPGLLQEHATALVFFFLYLLVSLGFTIAGVVVFVKTRKSIRLDKGQTLLMPSEKRKAAFVNAGVITAVAVLLVNTVAALYA